MGEGEGLPEANVWRDGTGKPGARVASFIAQRAEKTADLRNPQTFFGNTQPTFRAAKLRCPLVAGMATLGAAAGEGKLPGT